MSSTKFTIIKQCTECGKMFESQKRTTRFCSHKCNQKNYKRRKRLELVQKEESKQVNSLKPKIKGINIDLIRKKDFLNVQEVAFLFGCSKHTIYRMINTKEIHAVNLHKKLTRIRRVDIDALFSKPQQEQPIELTIDDCYLISQIIEKYKVSRNTIYNYGKKHNIQRIKYNGKTYYSKADIDNLFS